MKPNKANSPFFRKVALGELAEAKQSIKRAFAYDETPEQRQNTVQALFTHIKQTSGVPAETLAALLEQA